MKETLKMTIKEAERLSVMRQVDKKILTIRKAGEELGLSLMNKKITGFSALVGFIFGFLIGWMVRG
jgi:hypothetical protein